MVVVSEQVAEIVLPHLPVQSPPAKVCRTSAAYCQQKTTSAVEQRDGIIAVGSVFQCKSSCAQLHTQLGGFGRFLDFRIWWSQAARGGAANMTKARQLSSSPHNSPSLGARAAPR